MQVNKLNFSALFSEAWVQALTPKNILSGFHTTGVYPPDRSAIKLPGEKTLDLAQKTGIAYIPLYTPAKRRISDLTSVASSAISEDELEDFQSFYEEGGDSENPRYQRWVKMYHPESLLLSGSPLPVLYQPALKHSTIDQFLDCPDPPQRHPVDTQYSSLRVLTSSENLKRIEEKKKEKQRKAQEKEERAKLRGKKTHEGTAETLFS